MSEEKKQTAKERVDALHRAVEEAQASISATAVQIKELDKEITGELGKLEPDDDRLEQMEQEREKLADALERFEKRISALEAAIPEAERAVDEEELEEALVAYPALVEDANRAITKWRAGAAAIENLIKLAQTVASVTDKADVERDRILYLAALADRSVELPRREFIGEKEVETLRERAMAAFEIRKWSALSFHKSEWARKLEEFRAEEQRRQQQLLLDREYETAKRQG